MTIEHVKASGVIASGHQYLDSLDSVYRRAKCELNLIMSDPTIRNLRHFCQSFEEMEAALDNLNFQPNEQTRLEVERKFRQLNAASSLRW